jgi:uncharacterized protein YqhQ
MTSPSSSAGAPYREPTESPRLNVGGQAVIEGVMMRSPHCLAVAVRRANHEIVVREQPWKSSFATSIMKIPFVRGGLVLVESMRNGYEALRFSVQQFELDLPEAERSNDDSSVASRLGVVLALGFFVALPKLLTWLTGYITGHPFGMADPRFHILAGFFKLALFIGYLSLVRLSSDMMKVFQYHGAEHKAIAAYESGEALTVENAQRHSTRHARCGTTFLMVVVLVSVAVFALVLPMILPANGGLFNVILSIFISIPLLFPIAGFSYELQRLGARFTDNPIAKLFLYPGYLVQGLSTAEPTNDQVEIALAALRVTLTREAEKAPAPEAPTVQTFPDYARLSTEYGL